MATDGPRTYLRERLLHPSAMRVVGLLFLRPLAVGVATTGTPDQRALRTGPGETGDPLVAQWADWRTQSPPNGGDDKGGAGLDLPTRPPGSAGRGPPGRSATRTCRTRTGTRYPLRVILSWNRFHAHRCAFRNLYAPQVA